MGFAEKNGMNGCAAVMIHNSDAFDIEFVPMENVFDGRKQIDRDIVNNAITHDTLGKPAPPIISRI